MAVLDEHGRLADGGDGEGEFGGVGVQHGGNCIKPKGCVKQCGSCGCGSSDKKNNFLLYETVIFGVQQVPQVQQPGMKVEG